jgi:hypothetical protein
VGNAGEAVPISIIKLFSIGTGCPKCDPEADPDEVFKHQLHMIGDGTYEVREHFPGIWKSCKDRT